MIPEPFTQDEAVTLARFAITHDAPESFRHRPDCPGVRASTCPCPPAVVRPLMTREERIAHVRFLMAGQEIVQ